MAKMVSGRVGTMLFRLTVPMFFGIVGTIAFNLVDAFFIGQLGTIQLAAISFTFPVIFVLNGISFGLGVGASALISKAIGGNDMALTKRLTTDSLLLALLVVGIFIIAGYLTIDPVFRALGADRETLIFIHQYMEIWYAGMIFLVIPIVGNNAIRATGDTRAAGMIMMLGVLTNLILDPLLIFGFGFFPRLEMAGAAVATVIARAMTLIYSLYYLHYKYQMIDWTIPEFNALIDSWKKILYIGLPTATTNIMRPIAAGLVTRFVAGYGTKAVAAYGVATRIDLFAMTLIMALTSVLAPFVGQNMGAGNYDRVREAIKISKIFSLIWGLVALLTLSMLAPYIGPLFNRDPEVVNYMRTYLWIIPLGYGVYGIFNISNATLNVLNRPLVATALNFIQLFILLIPATYLLSQYYGLTGIFMAIPVTYLISGIAAHIWLRRIMAAQKIG